MITEIISKAFPQYESNQQSKRLNPVDLENYQRQRTQNAKEESQVHIFIMLSILYKQKILQNVTILNINQVRATVKE